MAFPFDDESDWTDTSSESTDVDDDIALSLNVMAVSSVIMEDNVDQLRDMSVDNVLAVHDEMMDRVAFCVYRGAHRCLAYLLTIPGLNIDKDVTTPQIPGFSGTPFTMAINQLIDDKKPSEDEVKCARLLARDHRTDLQLIIGKTVATEEQLSMFVYKQTMKGNLPDNGLLLDMLSNQSVDINQMFPYQVESANGSGTNTTLMSLFMCMMETGNEAIVDAALKCLKLDLSIQCTLFGQNALHYAMLRNLRFAVIQLLSAMSVEDTNRQDNAGQSPIRVWMPDDTVHPQLLLLLVNCPKIKIDDDLLGLFIYKANTCADLAKTKSPEEMSTRLAEYWTLITALIANPTFDMSAAMTSCSNPFMHMHLWPNEEMIVKLLNVDSLIPRLLRAEQDDLGRLVRPQLHQFHVMRASSKLPPYSIGVFKRIIEFAEIRDEISTPESLHRNFTAVHMAIYHERDDVLHQLLKTTTDGGVLRNCENTLRVTPRQLAESMKLKRCIRVIDSIEKKWEKGVTEVEYGHVFDCY